MFTEEEKEAHLKAMRTIRVDLIAAYNHEMQAIIGDELQQLLVILYFEGNEFSKRQIQKYCYEKLKEKNKLWESHQGDFRNIQYLDYYERL